MACGNVLCAQKMRCMNPSTCAYPIPSLNATHMQGWICPKCGSVWGPTIPGCFKCNNSAN